MRLVTLISAVSAASVQEQGTFLQDRLYSTALEYYTGRHTLERALFIAKVLEIAGQEAGFHSVLAEAVMVPQLGLLVDYINMEMRRLVCGGSGSGMTQKEFVTRVRHFISTLPGAQQGYYKFLKFVTQKLVRFVTDTHLKLPFEGLLGHVQAFSQAGGSDDEARAIREKAKSDIHSSRVFPILIMASTAGGGVYLRVIALNSNEAAAVLGLTQLASPDAWDRPESENITSPSPTGCVSFGTPPSFQTSSTSFSSASGLSAHSRSGPSSGSASALLSGRGGI